MLLVALACAFLIQAAVAKPYEIPTESMVPTIRAHDRIIANRLIYRFRAIHRGDIIVFTPPASAIATCAPPPGVPFVKRVIGVAGDRVVVRGGRTYVNGREMVVPGADPPRYEITFPAVPSGYLLVLGDNRNVSCDSHLWGGNPRDGEPAVARFAAVKDVIGQAEVVYWPPRQLSFLD